MDTKEQGYSGQRLETALLGLMVRSIDMTQVELTYTFDQLEYTSLVFFYTLAMCSAFIRKVKVMESRA